MTPNIVTIIFLAMRQVNWSNHALKNWKYLGGDKTCDSLKVPQIPRHSMHLSRMQELAST